MNAGKFSLTELKRLVADGQRRDLMDAKEYIQKYFYPLSNGMIVCNPWREKASNYGCV